MIKLNLNLPKHRLILNFGVTKRRDTSSENSIFPDLEEVKNVRIGSKFSRFFRHIFEHKNIRKVLGTNLTLMVIATTLLPSGSLAKANFSEEIITPAPISLTTERSVQYPVEKIVVTQGYRLFHPALDLDGITGDPIKPIKSGTVEAISRSRFAYGNAIIVNHGNGLTSLYAHLSKIFVAEGQEVTTLTIIGEMGNTGHSFGDHLHLEVRQDGRPISPLRVLPLP